MLALPNLSNSPLLYIYWSFHSEECLSCCSYVEQLKALLPPMVRKVSAPQLKLQLCLLKPSYVLDP